MRNRPWTTSELRYLREHASDGAAAIASHLGRTPSAVATYASRNGISLAQRYRCPKCGHEGPRPLDVGTGWCEACTLEERNRLLQEEVTELARQAERREAAKKDRQRLYSAKSRAVKKLQKP